jgi:hypothetical protein
MSPYFVKLFNKINICHHCKSSKLEGYSLCQTHLEQAKIRWRGWQIERHQSGKCCFCDHKSFKGWLRCRAHTKINRARCKAWIKLHPEHNKEVLVKRKQLVASGLCCSCKEHRKLDGQFKRCWICRTRHALSNKRNSKPIITKPTITEYELTNILVRNNLSKMISNSKAT